MSAHGPVACIGVFDGVHRGHRVLIERARAQADATGARVVAVTFDPHPMSVVGPEGPPPALASLDHRAELLLAAGADEVDILVFDEHLQATEPEDFVRRELVDRLGVSAVVVGSDFRFGRRARGDVGMLIALGVEHGFAVIDIPLVGSTDERWSSTLVRQLLLDGEVRAAADVLGAPYRIDGTVVHGDHRGRTLGFPTANLAWSDTPCIPADGVYAGWVRDGDERWPAAISVGTNPQFDGQERRIEAYVLDRDDLDLYGHGVGIEFAERIRGQLRFGSVDELVARIREDVAVARTLVHA